ncbi:MAG: OmpA family protein [Elusimicrobiota bacterium]
MKTPLLACFLAAVTAGCASTPRTSVLPVAAVEKSVRATSEEPDVRDMATREIPELRTVHFDYDSDLLDEDSRAILRSNAGYLRTHPETTVQISGNCDQRGTVAYNLALGQRRASSVRSYYKSLGIAASHVATISFGKERLLCPQDTDACWARNRRAATLEVYSPSMADQPTPGAP